MRELGIWQKQSSFYFHAVSAKARVEGNVFFNGPRAALNFNDGHAGGDVITGNLLVNAVRESASCSSKTAASNEAPAARNICEIL